MSDNIVGTQIGIYDVLYENNYKSKDGHRMYHVKCSKCGREYDMQKRHIKKAITCNHIGVDGNYINSNMKWSNHRLQRIYNHMRERCYQKECKDYRWYGAKGIQICNEWLNNPKSFEDWALTNGYKDELTIDRIDETKDYCPDNCIWISNEDNSRYKSTTSMIDVDGVILTGREWSKKLGLGINRINAYIREYGEENVKNFIRCYLANPGLTPKHRQSYYDLYMTIQN